MPKIEGIYSFISIDEGPDDEGIVAALVGDRWMLLVGADMDRVDSLRPLAMGVSRATGKSARAVIEEDCRIGRGCRIGCARARAHF